MAEFVFLLPMWSQVEPITPCLGSPLESYIIYRLPISRPVGHYVNEVSLHVTHLSLPTVQEERLLQALVGSSQSCLVPEAGGL